EASTNAIATQPLPRAWLSRARTSTPVFRVAPSPNGYLHVGHALSALVNFEMARAAGGRFLLRIEDIDAARCRPQYEAAIYEDLAWLGIAWEEPVRRQSAHMDEYKSVLDGLIARGLVYRDFRTRREIAEAIATAPHGEAPELVRGEALAPVEEKEKLAAGEAFAWRLSLKKARAALGPAYFTLMFREDHGAPASSPARFDQAEKFAGGGAGAPVNIRAEPERHGDVVLARK